MDPPAYGSSSGTSNNNNNSSSNNNNSNFRPNTSHSLASTTPSPPAIRLSPASSARTVAAAPYHQAPQYPTDAPGTWGSGDAAAANAPAAAGGGDGPPPPADGNPNMYTTNPQAASSSLSKAAGAKIRRRNRMITSCLECRRRKLKCDRLHPCSNCSKFKRHCFFLAPTNDALSRMKLMELKEKMGSLELVLEQDVVSRHGGTSDDAGVPVSSSATPLQGYTSVAIHHSTMVNIPQRSSENIDSNSIDGLLQSVEKENFAIPDDERFLRPTPLAVLDAAYDDDADDDTFDLGFKLGKMRLTDRIGGFFRPRIADELTTVLQTPKLSNDVTDTSLNTPVIPMHGNPPRLRDLMPEGKDSCFQPGPSYIAPRSDLFFGGGARKTSLADYLPTKPAADKLILHYWLAVHPVAKIVHRPTFERQYGEFWSDVSKSLEPPFSLQALVFAVLFNAVASMQEHLVLNTFGVSQTKLIDNFQLGTEMALGKAHFLKTTKTQTLQALVMYMIPMCRSEVSRTHSALVGTVIRLAECMGIHRDPEEYGHGPVETHIRRMIWYQLCFLDLRTSEAQGPRASIRREDFSTKFPINADDTDFAKYPIDQLKDMPRFTDMTFTRIRFECHELHRLVYVDRARLDKGTISLTHLLGKIEAFRRAAYAKYGPIIYVPNPTPIQRAAQLVMSILVCRCYTAVLHRYHSSVSVRIPDRLRQIIITASTQLLEDAIELETSPELQPWVWYTGAYNTWHVAFLILMEVWAYPMRKEAGRIWRCLDYVFETPSTASLPEGASLSSRQALVAERDSKARFIITQLRDRMLAYREMRKLRIPLTMVDTQVVHTSPEAPSREGTPSRSATKGSTGAETMISVPYNNNGSQPFNNSNSGSLAAPSSTHSMSQSPSPRTFNPELFQPHHQQQFQNPSVEPPPAPHLHQYYRFQTNHQPVQSLSSYPVTSSGYGNSHPAPYIPGYGTGRRNGRDSLDSGTTGSDESTNNLWFAPGADHASPGLAPPIPQPLLDPRAKLDNSEDLPMLDIDWNEWDKLFPPNINNGDLNGPPTSPLAATSTSSIDDAISSIHAISSQNYSGYQFGNNR
ncbi:hypothetical protein FQN57_002643 [Myotisia sp. PD_48]|nr:hypothetical protein FQN57_002643 [Myotisia sp. PD_48]